MLNLNPIARLDIIFLGVREVEIGKIKEGNKSLDSLLDLWQRGQSIA